MKTSELTGRKLREWVARAQGWKVELDVDSLICFDEVGTPHSFGEFGFCPDVNWAQGGPIMDAERISLLTITVNMGTAPPAWAANIIGMPAPAACGRTMLEAAMRAFVASKYGDTVPDE